MVEVSNRLAKSYLSISKSPSSSFLQSSSGAPLAGASHCRRPEPLGRQQQHPGREGGRAAPSSCQQQHPGREGATSSRRPTSRSLAAREEGGAEERPRPRHWQPPNLLPAWLGETLWRPLLCLPWPSPGPKMNLD